MASRASSSTRSTIRACCFRASSARRPSSISIRTARTRFPSSADALRRIPVEQPVRIAHISDLHCGSRYHIPSLATRVIDELNQLGPDAVVVTGDLTDMGFAPEMRAAQRLLSRIECTRRMVLLGNHDARNVGDELYESLFGARNSELAFG